MVPAILIPSGLWPQRVLVHYLLRGSPAASGKALSPQKVQPLGAKHHPEPVGNQSLPCTSVSSQLGSSSCLMGPPSAQQRQRQVFAKQAGLVEARFAHGDKGQEAEERENDTWDNDLCHWGRPDSCVSLFPSHQELALPLFTPCPSLGTHPALEGRSADSSSPQVAADRATRLSLAARQPGRPLGSAPLSRVHRQAARGHTGLSLARISADRESAGVVFSKH